MGMSNRIEAFILELLKNDDEWLELGRNELASVFNCVPSQINYVMQTRFSPERGYIVESRRGGGGYLRIKRISQAEESLIKHIITKIKNTIDFRTASSLLIYLYDEGKITKQNQKLILAAVSDKSLPYTLGEKRYEIRACILKNMLAELL